MQIPKVIIGIIIHNAEDSLSDCIDAIEAQTYQNISTVIVENGSTDNSKYRLQKKLGVKFEEQDENKLIGYNNKNVICFGQELNVAKCKNVLVSTLWKMTDFFILLEASVILYPDYVAKSLVPMVEDKVIGCSYSDYISANSKALLLNRHPAFITLSKEAISLAGGFNENLPK